MLLVNQLLSLQQFAHCSQLPGEKSLTFSGATLTVFPLNPPGMVANSPVLFGFSTFMEHIPTNVLALVVVYSQVRVPNGRFNKAQMNRNLSVYRWRSVYHKFVSYVFGWASSTFINYIVCRINMFHEALCFLFLLLLKSRQEVNTWAFPSTKTYPNPV